MKLVKLKELKVTPGNIADGNKDPIRLRVPGIWTAENCTAEERVGLYQDSDTNVLILATPEQAARLTGRPAKAPEGDGK